MNLSTVAQEQVQTISASVAAGVAATLTSAIVAAVSTALSSTVAAATTTAVGAAATTAVGAAVTTTVGGVAGGGAMGGAVGSAASSSVGSVASGGLITPLIFGIQRMAVASEGLALPKSDTARGVAASLSWSQGELVNIWQAPSGASGSAPGASGRARQLRASTLTGAPPEMLALLNILSNFAMALAFVLALYVITTCHWKHRMNRHYYQRKRRQSLPNDAVASAEGGSVPAEEIAFVPFPRSLVFPNPLYFLAATFVTGLSRSSVRLIVTTSSECGVGCRALGAAVLGCVGCLIIVAAIDLALFRWRHGDLVRWKPAAAVADRKDLTDPIMRMTATSRVFTKASTMVAMQRTSQVTSRLSTGSLKRISSVTSGRRSTKGLIVPITSSFKRPTRSFRKRTGLSGRSNSGFSSVEPKPAEDSRSAEAECSTSSQSGEAHQSHVASTKESSESFRARIRMQENSFSDAPARDYRTGMAQLGNSRSGLEVDRGSFNQSFGANQRTTLPPVKKGSTNPLPSQGSILKAAFPQARSTQKTVDVEPAVTPTRTTQMGPAVPAPAEANNTAALPVTAGSPMASLVEDEDLAISSAPAGFLSVRLRPLGGETASHSRQFVSSTSITMPSEHPTPPPSPPNPSEDTKVDQLTGEVPTSVATTDAGAPHAASPANMGMRTFRDAFTTSAEALRFRDRGSGTFSAPEEDAKEPERTERLLASPFSCCHRRAGDAFNQRAGYLLFRVRGDSVVGVYYRLLLIAFNMILGVITGLGSLLPPQSTAATGQVACVMALQLLAAALVYRYLPDADRIFSLFAATQFLIEGLGTASLLTSAFAAQAEEWKTTSFNMSIVAMGVPILQLVEQRILTPTAKAVQAHGCNPIQACAIGVMILIGLPGKLMKLIAKLGGCDAGDDSNNDQGPSCCESCCKSFMSFFGPVLAPILTLWSRAVAARESAQKKVKVSTADDAGDAD